MGDHEPGHNSPKDSKKCTVACGLPLNEQVRSALANEFLPSTIPA